MGVWNKIKGFFGRVWGGVKKGFSKVKDVVKKVVTPVYNTLKPAINLIPGASAITGVIDKVLPVVNGLPNDAGGAIKAGVNMLNQKLNPQAK